MFGGKYKIAREKYHIYWENQVLLILLQSFFHDGNSRFFRHEIVSPDYKLAAYYSVYQQYVHWFRFLFMKRVAT